MNAGGCDVQGTQFMTAESHQASMEPNGTDVLPDSTWLAHAAEADILVSPAGMPASCCGSMMQSHVYCNARRPAC